MIIKTQSPLCKLAKLFMARLCSEWTRLTLKLRIVDVDAIIGPFKSTWSASDQSAHERRKADNAALFRALRAASDPVADVVHQCH